IARTRIDRRTEVAVRSRAATPTRLLEQLLDRSSDGLLAFDLEFRYMMWNAAMERISGVLREEALGRVAFELFPFLVETGQDECHRAALEGRTVETQRGRFEVPETGRRGWFDGRYAPILDDTGAVVGGSATIV